MFKRLTYHVKDGRYSLQKKRTSENIQEAINRLGEYENTWLTPEEIIKLLNTNDKLNTALDKAIDIIGDSRCPPDVCLRKCSNFETCLHCWKDWLLGGKEDV